MVVVTASSGANAGSGASAPAAEECTPGSRLCQIRSAAVCSPELGWAGAACRPELGWAACRPGFHQPQIARLGRRDQRLAQGRVVIRLGLLGTQGEELG